MFRSDYFWAKALQIHFVQQLGINNSIERELMYNGSLVLTRLFRGATHAKEFGWGAQLIIDKIVDYFGDEAFVSRQVTDAQVDVLQKYQILSYRCAVILYDRRNEMENLNLNEMLQIGRIARVARMLRTGKVGPVVPLWHRITNMKKEELSVILKPTDSNLETVGNHIVRHGGSRDDIAKIIKESSRNYYPLCHWFILVKLYMGSLKTNEHLGPTKICSMCKLPDSIETLQHPVVHRSAPKQPLKIRRKPNHFRSERRTADVF